MADIDPDPEANFFDQPPRHGQRRDTIVFELSNDERIAVSKLRADASIYLFYELIIGALVGSVIIQKGDEKNI